jgi:hypothetical protein
MAQKIVDVEKKWNQTQREIEFGIDPNVKKPYDEDWWSNSPHYESDEETIFEDEEVKQDFEEQIKRGRKRSTMDSKKEMKKTEMAEPPEFDPPDFDEPDFDVDAPDPSKISQSTLKTVLILLLFVGLVTGLYFWLKKQNSNPKFIQEFDDDWNPEIVTKSELDIRLEQALINSNYRECIRIYFTLVLQLLITRELIKWRREKTNHEYLFEIPKGNLKKSFAECIRIFDLVWYGEFQLDKRRFEKLQIRFEALLNDLNANFK